MTNKLAPVLERLGPQNGSGPRGKENLDQDHVPKVENELKELQEKCRA